MIDTDVKSLLIDTIRTPHEAARRLIAFRLPRNWLWTALALMCVLNAIVYSLSLYLAPPATPQDSLLIPPFFRSPVLFTLFLFTALALTVAVTTRLGRAMGGQGQIDDMLVLVTWLQVLRLLLQAAMLVFGLIAPGLGVLLVLVASLWGIYVFAAFIDVAHRYDNTFKAMGVMVLAFVIIALAMTLILSILGPSPVGAPGNV